MQKATSANPKIRKFFAGLSGNPAFFSKSLQRIAVLEEIAGRRVPSLSNIRCSFKSRTVNTVKKMKTAIIECCEKLPSSSSNKTSLLATGIKHNLESASFNFWLDFFCRYYA